MNNNKKHIRKILKEYMEGKITEWKHNISELNGALTTLISEDNETGEKLYLFVGLNQMLGNYSEYYEYSYSFMLFNSENQPLTEFLTTRNRVKKYLPKELTGTRNIFPIIMELTRMLLRKNMNINNIFIKTEEILSGDSLQRYTEITKIMTDEFGFTVIEEGNNNFGLYYWKLSKNQPINENNQIKKDPFLTYSSKDTQAAWNKKLPEIIAALQKKDKEKKNNETNN